MSMAFFYFFIGQCYFQDIGNIFYIVECESFQIGLFDFLYIFSVFFGEYDLSYFCTFGREDFFFDTAYGKDFSP